MTEKPKEKKEEAVVSTSPVEPKSETFEHHFICLENAQHKLSLESPERSNNKAFDIPKLKCPQCMAVGLESGLQLDPARLGVSVGSAKSLENMRKANREASSVAMQAAAQHAATVPQKEMVTVVPNAMNRGGQYGEASSQIPKTVIDSITEKARAAGLDD